MSDFSTNSAALKLKPFERPVAKVLAELSERPEAMDDLMVDPTGFLMLRISPSMASKLPRTTLNAANRFLYSALANEPFKKWLMDYNDQLIQEIDTNEFAELDESKIRGDLAAALLEHGDKELIKAILDVPQTPIIPGQPEGKAGCCNDDDESPFPVPDPFGPTPVPEAAAVAVAVAVVAVAAVAVVGVLVVAADTPLETQLQSNRMKAFSMTGRELQAASEALINYSERLRAAGKI